MKNCLKCEKECTYAAVSVAGKTVCIDCWNRGVVDIKALEESVTPILENKTPTDNERLLGEAVLALLIVIRKLV